MIKFHHHLCFSYKKGKTFGMYAVTPLGKWSVKLVKFSIYSLSEDTSPTVSGGILVPCQKSKN